jgi:protein-disulfide isomerase
MKNLLITIIAAVFLVFSLSAWPASTKDEVLKLQTQVEQMQKDLDEIKKLLQEGARAPTKAPSQPGFKPQTVSIGSSPYMGDPDAKVTIIEYSDYQCPFCARHYRQVLPLIKKEYIDTGQVKFVMREFPLTNIHRNAMDASIAARCAGDQDMYWEMHNLLFDNQKQLGIDNLKSFAETLGLDTVSFNECLDGKKHDLSVRSDLASGAKLGNKSTPGFFLGLTDPGDPDKVEVSVYVKGAQGIDQFRGSIDDLLASGE